MKTISILSLLFLAASCSTQKTKKPVYVEYFKQGQIILPDMVCSDTLIVVNAVVLNKSMAYYEQGLNDYGDEQLDSMFHANCLPIKF